MLSIARRARAKQISGEYFFPPSWIGEAACALSGAMGLAFVYFGATGPPADRRFLVCLGIGFFLMGLVGFPKGIWFNEDGARQRRWFGTWNKIAWPNVREVTEGKDGSVTLRGSHSRIELTKFHGGRAQFLLEVRRHRPQVTAHLINVTPSE